MRTKLVLLLLFITGTVGSSIAQYPEPTSLKGLKNIVFKVYADRGVPHEGIEEQALQELKEAGIGVLSEKESQPSPDVSVLHLNMFLSCEPDGASCGYQTNLELRQRVQLVRDRNITVSAVTWLNSYTGGVNKAQLSTLRFQLAVDARTLVLGFVSDYRTANPR
jgi:hypothetical protein